MGALLIGRLALGRRPEDEGTSFLGTSQALFSANDTDAGQTGFTAVAADVSARTSVLALQSQTSTHTTRQCP